MVGQIVAGDGPGRHTTVGINDATGVRDQLEGGVPFQRRVERITRNDTVDAFVFQRVCHVGEGNRAIGHFIGIAAGRFYPAVRVSEL